MDDFINFHIRMMVSFIFTYKILAADPLHKMLQYVFFKIRTKSRPTVFFIFLLLLSILFGFDKCSLQINVFYKVFWVLENLYSWLLMSAYTKYLYSNKCQTYMLLYCTLNIDDFEFSLKNAQMYTCITIGLAILVCVPFLL